MTEQDADEETLSVQSKILQLALHPASRRLLHLIRTRGDQTIAVQSQFPGEGRTFVTSLLAQGAFHFIQLRVLIVDTVSSVATESLLNPLACHLNETSRIDVALVKTLFQKPPNSHVSTLQSARMGRAPYPSPSDFALIEYLESARDSYDLILIDCASFDSIRDDDPDPAIMAHHSDSSLIVTSPRGLTQSALTSLQSLIHRFKINPIGMVFNGGGACEPS